MRIKKLMDAIKKIIKNPNLISELIDQIDEQNKEMENLRNDKYGIEEEKETLRYENNCLYGIRKEMKKQLNQMSEQVEHMLNYVVRDNSKLEVEKIYDRLKFIDTEGWCIYGASKEILAIDVFREFVVEDTMGRFEESDGHELKDYMEIAAFGDCTYKVISGSYEILDKYTIDYDSKEYKEYLNELYPLVVSKLVEKLHKEESLVKLQYIQHHMEDSIQKTEKDEIESETLIVDEVKEVQAEIDDEEVEM